MSKIGYLIWTWKWKKWLSVDCRISSWNINGIFIAHFYRGFFCIAASSNFDSIHGFDSIWFNHSMNPNIFKTFATLTSDYFLKHQELFLPLPKCSSNFSIRNIHIIPKTCWEAHMLFLVLARYKWINSWSKITQDL